MSDFDDTLAHFGVKGMHWGVRKSGSAPPVSEDAQQAVAAKQKVKAGGTKALSNRELQDVINRMNLEQQFTRLNPSKTKKTLKFVTDILAIGNTVNQAMTFANSPTGKAIKDAVTKK